MATNFFKIKKGINLDPTTGSTVTVEGDQAYNVSTHQLEVFGAAAAESITTASNTQTFTGKAFDVDGSGNSLSNVANASIKSAAGIVYSKLNLTGGVVNADVNASAAIAYSKLALTGSILNADLAGSITAAKLVGSDIATVGTITSGTWSATTIALNKGGTGQTTKAPAFDALQPMTTAGDMIYGGASGTGTRLAIGNANQVLQSVNGTPTWSTVNLSGINYINSNPSAEVDTSGWVTYADAAANIPVDGTGGSPNTTWTRSTSSPLRGTGSFLWTKSSGASRQGEGVGYAFTIDSADQAKPLAITFDYIIASGTFTASDGITAPLNDGTTSITAGNSTVEAFIYDVTNAILIPVSPQVLVSNSTTTPNTFKATFQTASNSTSYRLILHTAMATDAAMTMKFDNFFVGPQAVSYGAPAEDWNTNRSLTPNNFGTVSSATYITQRNADNLNARGGWVSGTVVAATASITLPAGLTIDSSKLSSNAGGTRVGTAKTFNAGGNRNIYDAQEGDDIFYDGSDTSKVYFGYQNASGAYTKKSASDSASSGNVTFDFSVPIAGWSSTVLMSNDTDTRVVAAKYTTATAQSTPDSVATTIIWTTKVIDTHASMNASTGVYTVPVSGVYKIHSCVVEDSPIAGGTYNFRTRKNSTDSQEFVTSIDSTRTMSCAVSDILTCVAGDTIDIQLRQNNSSTNQLNGVAKDNWVTIERLTGPSAIAASEKIVATYTSSGHSTTANNPINYETKLIDTHGAVTTGSSWKFTAPRAGNFSVSANYTAAATIYTGTLYKNGSIFITLATALTTTNASGSITIPLIAGDYIDVRPDSTETISGSISIVSN